MSNKRVSAFKLFYDEFIYKENNNITYANIEFNITKIRDLVIDFRKSNVTDLDLYATKLDRVNKRIKEQLDLIYEANPTLYEYFYLMYKSRCDYCNDKVADMPFIISCSFYNDYRLDNKTLDELESSSYVIPKYSSIEKKEIRSKAKGLSRLEFLVEILSESNDSKLFSKFIKESKMVLNYKPLLNESHNNFFNRIMGKLGNYNHLYNRALEKAQEASLIGDIVLVMEIAFRKKFNDYFKDYDKLINEHLDIVYKRMEDSFVSRTYHNKVNDIDYEDYLNIIDQAIIEKEQYSVMALSGKFKEVSYVEDNYINTFKEALINSYFDSRYYMKISDDCTSSELIDYVIGLYDLSLTLRDQLFLKLLYDASHITLMRSNDVRSAIVSKIYNIYNPFDKMEQFNKLCMRVKEVLKANNFKFETDFNNKLVDIKNEYNYHGPIPTMEATNIFLKNKVREFILDNLKNELFNLDTNGDYDTRNYDLTYLAKIFSINELTLLYEDMKDKIKSLKLDSKYEVMAQKLIVVNITMKLKVDSSLDIDKIYDDVCNNYLHEECLFNKGFKSTKSVNRINEFRNTKREYSKNSNWNQLLKNNNFKYVS